MDVHTRIGMANSLGSLLLLLCLSACDGDSSQVAEAAETKPLFILSADGVGPLNGDTPFNFVRIGEAFQNYNVAQETHFLKGEKFPVITVKQRVTPLLSINPDYREEGVFSIVVHNNLIGNGLGHQIGDKFNEIYSYGNTEECGPGMDEWVGKVMCYAPQTRNVLYLFSGNQQMEDNKVPSPDVMMDWALESIVWKPPGA